MPYVRKFGEDHISKSLKQIDSNTWLIGGLILHRSPFSSETATWNDDGDNSSYKVTEAPTPLPSATTPPDSPYIKKVYEAGCAHVIWRLGNKAFCKVRYIDEGVTPEPVTMDFVRDKRPSFEVPKILHYATDTDRYYLFYQRLPGRTLDAAWSSLDNYWRRHYINAVANIVKEMAEWKGQAFGGVDGGNVAESYLLDRGEPEDFSSANLLDTCKLLGMDCADLVFFHALLDPGSVIVESKPDSGKVVGIVDWEGTGYFPRSWLATKFLLCAGLDLDSIPWASVTDNRHEYRGGVAKELVQSGLDEFSDAWWKWRGLEQSA